MTLEQDNAGPEQLDARKIKDLVEADRLPEAKKVIQDILETDPLLLKETMRTEEAPVVSVILDVLGDWGPQHDTVRTELLLSGFDNPDENSRVLVTKALWDTKIHIGLFKRLNDPDINQPQLMRAMLALPVIPAQVEEQINLHPDPFVANALARQLLKLRLKHGGGQAANAMHVHIRLNTPAGLNNPALQKDLDALEHDTTVEPIHRGIMAGSKAVQWNAKPENDFPEIAKRMSNDAEFVQDCRKGRRDKLVAYFRKNDLPANDAFIDAFLKAGNFEKLNPHVIEQKRLLIFLKYAKDQKPYNEYLRILADPAIAEEKKTAIGMRMLQETLIKEMQEDAPMVQVVQKNTIQQIRDFTSAVSEGVNAIKKAGEAVQEVAAVITPVAVKQMLTKESEGDKTAEEVRAEVNQKITPEMQQVLASGTITTEGDDTVNVELANKTSVNIKVRNGTISASVPARDGTTFPLEHMDMQSLETTILFRVIPYEIHRTIFDGNDQDTNIVRSVFGMDTGDDTLIKQEEMERFTQYQRGQSNIRKKALNVFRELGVIDEHTQLNIKRARATQNLLKYLDAHMGLEYVTEQDMKDIAASWEKKGTTELLTPWAARRILEQQA